MTPPDPPAANADQIAYWNAAAGNSWARHQEHLDRQIEPLGRQAMEALGPRRGERLVDVGCGCGQTTLELAERVSGDGAVLGLDISAQMLSVARERASRAGAGQIRFLEADAQTHAFEPGGADGAFSRFGVMFFAGPAAAFRNIRAALAPGGRLAFVCWRDVALNPFMTVPYAAALPVLPPPSAPGDPYAPGPFAFADGERVRAILAEAGFTDIDLRAHDEAIGGGNLEETARLALSIGPLGMALRASPELAGPVRDHVRSALAAYETTTGVFMDSASWIVTARNP